VQEQYVPVSWATKILSFVMEDVDAASKVVKRRDRKRLPRIQIDDVRASQIHAANAHREFRVRLRGASQNSD
jgi:hypothetical protein